jgi:hypothetical protein
MDSGTERTGADAALIGGMRDFHAGETVAPLA